MSTPTFGFLYSWIQMVLVTVCCNHDRAWYVNRECDNIRRASFTINNMRELQCLTHIAYKLLTSRYRTLAVKANFWYWVIPSTYNNGLQFLHHYSAMNDSWQLDILHQWIESSTYTGITSHYTTEVCPWKVIWSCSIKEPGPIHLHMQHHPC